MSDTEDPHEAVGAYVLHALPPEEAAAFATHLAGCDACTREVADLEATVACLAEAEVVTPPDALRRMGARTDRDHHPGAAAPPRAVPARGTASGPGGLTGSRGRTRAVTWPSAPAVGPLRTRGRYWSDHTPCVT